MEDILNVLNTYLLYLLLRGYNGTDAVWIQLTQAILIFN